MTSGPIVALKVGTIDGTSEPFLSSGIISLVVEFCAAARDRSESIIVLYMLNSMLL